MFRTSTRTSMPRTRCWPASANAGRMVWEPIPSTWHTAPSRLMRTRRECSRRQPHCSAGLRQAQPAICCLVRWDRRRSRGNASEVRRRDVYHYRGCGLAGLHLHHPRARVPRAGTNDRSGDPRARTQRGCNTSYERRACRGRQRQEHHISCRTSVRLFKAGGIAWAIRSCGC